MHSSAVQRRIEDQQCTGLKSIAGRIMQMHDFPLAVRLVPNRGEAHIRALVKSGDYRHLSVMPDLLLNIWRWNTHRATSLYASDLLGFRLWLLVIRNRLEIIGLN